MKIERTKIQVLDQLMADVNELGITASKLISELSVNGVDVDLDDAYDWMTKVAELRRAMKAVRGAFYASNIRGLIDTVNNKEDDRNNVVNVDGERICDLLNDPFNTKI